MLPQSSPKMNSTHVNVQHIVQRVRKMGGIKAVSKIPLAGGFDGFILCQ